MFHFQKDKKRSEHNNKSHRIISKLFEKTIPQISLGRLQNGEYHFVEKELPFVVPSDTSTTFLYTNRFVCFLDILGCKSLVDSSTLDLKAYNKLAMIAEMFKKLEEDYKSNHWRQNFAFPITRDGITANHIIHEENIQVELSLFSDSIIISYEPEKSDLFISWYRQIHQILNDLCRLQYEFAVKGVFLRGGLTFGHIYHHGNVCFGPALVKAVSLESTAVNPCIAVDEEIAEKILSDRYSKMSYDPAPGFKLPLELSDAANDLWGEYLNRGDCWDNNSEGPKFMVDWLSAKFMRSKTFVFPIRESIQKELNRKYPPRIMKKYEWLKSYYNYTLFCVSAEYGEKYYL